MLRGAQGASLAAAVRRALTEPREASEDEKRWYVEQLVGDRVVEDGPMTHARASEIEWQRRRQGVPGVCRIVQRKPMAVRAGDVIDIEPAPLKLASGPVNGEK